MDGLLAINRSLSLSLAEAKSERSSLKAEVMGLQEKTASQLDKNGLTGKFTGRWKSDTGCNQEWIEVKSTPNGMMGVSHSYQLQQGLPVVGGQSLFGRHSCITSLTMTESAVSATHNCLLPNVYVRRAVGNDIEICIGSDSEVISSFR